MKNIAVIAIAAHLHERLLSRATVALRDRNIPLFNFYNALCNFIADYTLGNSLPPSAEPSATAKEPTSPTT